MSFALSSLTWYPINFSVLLDHFGGYAPWAWLIPTSIKSQSTRDTHWYWRVEAPICLPPNVWLFHQTSPSLVMLFLVITSGFLYSWYLHLLMTLCWQWPENPCIDACCSHDDGGPRFPSIFVYRHHYQFQYEVSCRFLLLLLYLQPHYHPFAHDRTTLSMHTTLMKSLFIIKWGHSSWWWSKGWLMRLTDPWPVPVPGAIKSDYIKRRKADEVTTTPVSQPTKDPFCYQTLCPLLTAPITLYSWCFL